MKKLLLLSFCIVTGCSPQKAPHSAGKKPTVDQAMNIVFEHYRDTLKDPSSAKYKFEKVIHTDFFKAPYPEWSMVQPEGTRHYICVSVNGKNSYGGYVGFDDPSPFIIHNGKKDEQSWYGHYGKCDKSKLSEMIKDPKHLEL